MTSASDIRYKLAILDLKVGITLWYNSYSRNLHEIRHEVRLTYLLNPFSCLTLLNSHPLPMFSPKRTPSYTHLNKSPAQESAPPAPGSKKLKPRKLYPKGLCIFILNLFLSLSLHMQSVLLTESKSKRQTRLCLS